MVGVTSSEGFVVFCDPLNRLLISKKPNCRSALLWPSQKFPGPSKQKIELTNKLVLATDETLDDRLESTPARRRRRRVPYRTDDYETFRIRPLVPKGRFIYRTREDRAAWTGLKSAALQPCSS